MVGDGSDTSDPLSVPPYGTKPEELLTTFIRNEIPWNS